MKRMRSHLTPNIGTKGRVLRGAIALALLFGAAAAYRFSPWAALGLGISGGFVLFEASRGWCALRACGIKTRL